MLRALSLTVVVLTVSATSAQAGDNRIDAADEAVIASTPQGRELAAGRAQPSLQEPQSAVRFRIGGALAWVQPALRASVAAIPHRPTLRGVEARPRAKTRSGGLFSGLGRLTGGTHRPMLAYAVNRSLSLGLEYQYMDVEDMTFRLAEPGAIDPKYNSHNVFLQAWWQF